MNNENPKSQKSRYLEENLGRIAKQMEGQVNSFLPQREYRLHIFAPYYEGQEPTYGKLEEGIRLYPVPDFRTAILVMDILYSEYTLMKYDFVLIGFEWLDPKTNQWEEWEDSEGNTLSEYYLNENYVLHLGDGEYDPFDYNDYEEGDI